MKRRFLFLVLDASCLSSSELTMQLKFNSGKFLAVVLSETSII